jgi:hypothetical protein
LRVILSAFRDVLGPGVDLADYNDSHTKEEVLALWKRVGKLNHWL